MKTGITVKLAVVQLIIVSVSSGDHRIPSSTHQHFVQQPSNTSVRLGHSVVLPCQVSALVGEIQWTRDQFGLGVGRQLTAWPRYRLTGDLTLGHGRLHIDRAQLDDQGVYQCQAGAAQGQPGIRSRDAWLTVLVAPDRVTLEPSGQVTVTSGQVVRLQCTCHGVNPLPQIEWSWSVDSSGPADSNITSSHQSLADGGRLQLQSQLAFVARRRHHRAAVTCTVRGEALMTPSRAVSTRLDVLHVPVVRVIPAQPRAAEYGDVLLTCTATANPGTNLTYSWRINEQLATATTSRQLQLKSVGRQLHNANISCHVTNSVGYNSSTVQLDVRYAAQFIAEPVDVSADSGQMAALFCQVDGNPAPQIRWYKMDDNHSKKMVGVGDRLSLRVGLDSIGVYECRVTGTDTTAGHIWKRLRLRMRSRPQVTAVSPAYAIEGSRVHLQCSVFSVPPPTATNWYMYSRSLHNDADHFTMVNMAVDGGFTSRLVIDSVTQDDYGVYNCTFWNARGAGSAVVVLHQTNSSVLVLTLCGLSGVLLLLAGVVVWIVFRRRHHRTLPTLPDGQRCHEGMDNMKKTCGVNLRPMDSKSDTFSSLSGRSSSLASSGVVTVIANNMIRPQPHRSSSYFETPLSQHPGPFLAEDVHRSQILAAGDGSHSAMYGNPFIRSDLTLSRLPPPPSYRSSTHLATHV